MNSRRLISLLLLTVYMAASGVNSFGLMRCDCRAHHGQSHAHCCGHHDHSHSECSAACLAESRFAVSEECSCRHSLDEGEFYTFTADTDELLRYIKIFAVDAVRPFDVPCAESPRASVAVVRCRDAIPLQSPLPISSGAPRAPSVQA